MRINADEPSLKGSGSSSLYGFNANLNAVTSFSSNDYELQATDNGKVVTIDNSETDAFVSIPNGLPAGFMEKMKRLTLKLTNLNSKIGNG